MKLTKEQFSKILNPNELPVPVDQEFLYGVYELSYDGILEFSKAQVSFDINSINNIDLCQYIIGEYLYSIAKRSKKDLVEFHKNEDILTSMAGVVADKYLSMNNFSFKGKQVTNKYFPNISSISVYLNLMLNIVQNYEKNDPESTLITDLLFKALTISRSIIMLLVNGSETEAFACWRTLHECESTLIILEKYGEPAIKRYLKHMTFGLAFKDTMPDKEKQTEIFNSMKEEMKNFDLKSKDIKKYVEYGWLYYLPGIDKDMIKLNFRDGLEKVAGLNKFSDRYEMSSEIIHSTPILIYSNKIHFFYVTLLSLYESFFRIEKVFVSLFSKRVTKEQYDSYIKMKNVYYVQLVNIYKRELNNFVKFQQN